MVHRLQSISMRACPRTSPMTIPTRGGLMKRVIFGLLAFFACSAGHAAEIMAPASERFAAAEGAELPSFQRHVIPLLGRLGCIGDRATRRNENEEGRGRPCASGVDALRFPSPDGTLVAFHYSNIGLERSIGPARRVLTQGAGPPPSATCATTSPGGGTSTRISSQTDFRPAPASRDGRVAASQPRPSARQRVVRPKPVRARSPDPGW